MSKDLFKPTKEDITRAWNGGWLDATLDEMRQGKKPFGKALITSAASLQNEVHHHLALYAQSFHPGDSSDVSRFQYHLASAFGFMQRQGIENLLRAMQTPPEKINAILGFGNKNKLRTAGVKVDLKYPEFTKDAILSTWKNGWRSACLELLKTGESFSVAFVRSARNLPEEQHIGFVTVAKKYSSNNSNERELFKRLVSSRLGLQDAKSRSLLEVLDGEDAYTQDFLPYLAENQSRKKAAKFKM